MELIVLKLIGIGAALMVINGWAWLIYAIIANNRTKFKRFKK